MDPKHTDIETRLANTRDRMATCVFLGRVSVIADRPTPASFPREVRDPFAALRSLFKAIQNAGMRWLAALRVNAAGRFRRASNVGLLGVAAVAVAVLLQTSTAAAPLSLASEHDVPSTLQPWANWEALSLDAQAAWSFIRRESASETVHWSVCWPPTPVADVPSLTVFALCRSVEDFKLGWVFVIADLDDRGFAFSTLHFLAWNIRGWGSGEWTWANSPMKGH